MSFFNLHFIFYFFITTKPTKAHSSQRRPMQANEDEKRLNLGLHLPSTTTNESRRLVGGLLSLHLPSTTTNESRRLVGGFLGLHLPSTTTNESRRLVGGFLGLHLPSTTTNESRRLVGGL